MIDIDLIRTNPEKVKEALLKRMNSVDLESILQLDRRNRELKTCSDRLKEKKNRASSSIPSLKKEGRPVDGLLREMKDLSREIGELDKAQKVAEASLYELMARLPNIPADHVPAGGKENNRVVRVKGEAGQFDFEPKDHIALSESLGLIDYPRGAKLGGAGHWVYTGKGALLEWALLNYFIEEHGKGGYTFLLPPHMLNRECGYTAGQFPKFDEDVYYLEGDKKTFLLPTAETALVNFHRNEILSGEDLPARYFSYTPCYRKEAGSYRSEERGMIRGHQFNKVEMFQYCRPEDSDKALKELVHRVESLMDGLELHYRVSQLAAGDCSAGMAETIDIEVWIPSMGGYKEVSSASNAGDYQARRGNIRYRDQGRERNRFVHTLNASGLATSRLVPALLEQHQNADGSVNLPKVLRNRTGLGETLD